MKLFLKYILPIIMITTLAEASSARGGVLTFTQADGTQFEGVLRGDSAFHWIESNSKIVMYNSEDKYYYYATLNAQNKFELTGQKPEIKSKTVSSTATGFVTTQNMNLQKIDSATRKALQKMQKESRQGHHPR